MEPWQSNLGAVVIKGYFDFVNHNRLLCELHQKWIPLEYVQWTAAFLSGREAAVCLDGVWGPMQPVDNGIPQGSPISPILAAFYTAELLELFESKAHPSTFPYPDGHTPVAMFMYVDNGKIFISSSLLETNIDILKLNYHKVEDWGHGAGLSIDTSKHDLMHYMKWKTDGSPAIALLNPDGTTRAIVAGDMVSGLGFFSTENSNTTNTSKLLQLRQKCL
jgi:hypothetical protein